MATMIALSTAGTVKEAKQIARAIVEENLAACVNILPGVASFFYWGGKICEEREAILLIKTHEAQLNKMMKRIKELNSYELPEMLYFRIDGGDKKYLQWIKGDLFKKNIDNKKTKR